MVDQKLEVRLNPIHRAPCIVPAALPPMVRRGGCRRQLSRVGPTGYRLRSWLAAPLVMSGSVMKLEEQLRRTARAFREPGHEEYTDRRLARCRGRDRDDVRMGRGPARPAELCSTFPLVSAALVPVQVRSLTADVWAT
jgi:hypothetical protein